MKLSLSLHNPVYRTIDSNVDFLGLLTLLEERFSSCFLLESLGEYETARYSLIGFDPVAVIRAEGKTLTINDESYEVEHPYEALRTLLPHDLLTRNYIGGLVGYLSYEAAAYFEPSLPIKADSPFGQFCFGVYTDGLLLDRVTGVLTYFYLEEDRYEQIAPLLTQSVPEVASPQVAFNGSNLSKSEHTKVVNRVLDEVRAGNTFQCEVGWRENYTITGSSIPLYAKLRETNPSPHMYYLKFGENVLLGASPELLFKLQDGQMETFPLAGTIRRGNTHEEDQQLAHELLNNPKEIAEHKMLVDLHRNDLGRVARFATVKVREFMDIKKFSHVQHISSEITGIIAPHEDMFSAIKSNFPAGTLSGAPKIESMKIIARNEPEARGPYGGGVGYFGFNGDCEFAIPIRSIFRSGDQMYLQACGGIVYDSDPELEYEEVMNKLAATRSVVEAFI